MNFYFKKPKEFFTVGMILVFCANTNFGIFFGFLLLFFWLVSSDN